MGIRILILQACLIRGEEMASHAAVGDQGDVSKEDASYLTRAGRALYLDKSDDPTKGLLTATREDRERVAKQANAIEAAAEIAAAAAAPVAPVDMSGLMAEAISSAISQGIAAGLAAVTAKPATPSA